MAIATRFGRPGAPNDQAWIESLFGHLKGEWPHLEKIRHPGTLAAALDRIRIRRRSAGCVRRSRSRSRRSCGG
jgi:transposase InsO family protein